MRNSEKGFTLIELLIAIFLLTIIPTVIFFYFNAENDRAKLVYQTIQSFNRSSLVFKNDVNCYPNTSLTELIYINNENDEGYNNCSINTDKWSGPYVNSGSFYQKDNILYLRSDLSPNSEITFNFISNPSSLVPWVTQPAFATEINNITSKLATSFMKYCEKNGNSKETSCFKIQSGNSGSYTVGIMTDE